MTKFRHTRLSALEQVCAQDALSDPDPLTRALLLGFNSVDEYAGWIRNEACLQVAAVPSTYHRSDQYLGDVVINTLATLPLWRTTLALKPTPEVRNATPQAKLPSREARSNDQESTPRV